jgi:hypothetical protein
MLRVIVLFFVLFTVFYVGIPAFRALTGREKWELTKNVVYSTICSVLAIVVMLLIVVTF